jgi:hypothetical protein
MTSTGIVDVANDVMYEGPLAGQYGKARIDVEVHSLAQFKHSKALTVHGGAFAARNG